MTPSLRERIDYILDKHTDVISDDVLNQILLAIKEALPERKNLSTSGMSCDETVGFNKAIEEMERRLV